MRVYRKTPRGYYSYGIYHYLSFWIVVFLGSFLLSTYILDVFKIELIRDVEAISFAGAVFLGAVEVVKILIGSIRSKGLFKYVSSLSLERRIRKAFLNTMTLNTAKDLPRIEVPKIKASFADNKVYVFVQRLVGMNDIEKIEANINASTIGKYKKFAVVEAIKADDGTNFNFVLEDLGTDKTFVPNSIEDLKQKSYFIKLQEGLTLNLSKFPHVAIWGQTGSGKTTVLMSIIVQCLSNGTDLYFIDGKTEFSSFGVFYPKEKIATDNEEVVSLLKGISQMIVKRQKQMANAVQKRKQLGLTGFDIKLKPV